ncbi:MAG: surface-adhesin E family protein, partial [Burkholderiaceae bacterium]
MIIKKITLLISLMMLFLPAKAEWTHVGTSGSSVLDFYVDYKNIAVEGNYVKSKRLVDYHKEQKTEKGEVYWSAITIYTFDCM